MKLSRPVIYFGALAIAVVTIVILSAVLLPRLIDSQLIRDKISSEVAKNIQGGFTFGKIALVWVPRPTVVIENAKLSFDDAQSSIQTAKIYPSILDLLAGRLVVRRAALHGAEIRFRLPKSSESPLDLDELEKQIGAALTRLISELPARRMDLSDGFVEISAADHAPVILENLTAQTNSSPSDLQFALSARSNLCERVRIEGKIAPVNLASQLDVGVQRLKVNDSLALLGPQGSQYLQRGEASFDVKIASVGLRKVKASIDGIGGPFVFARHGSTATVEAKRLKGGLTYQGGTVQFAVDRLDLDSPRLQASGDLKISSDLSSGHLDARGVDIAEVGNLALRLVDDPEGVQRILRYVPAGTIPEMSIQSTGRSFADMALSKNVVLSGLLRDGQIFIAGSDLELNNVSGSVRISDGVLDANDVSANLGTTRGWNGKVKLGLDGQTAAFHLDILVHTRAPELQSVLLKLVRDEAFRRELSKVQDVAGELSGRLILGETLDAVSPVVAVAKADLSATYAPIPFPIAIRGARFRYDQRLIRLENAEGSVGHSSFGGLDVTFHLDGSGQVKVDSGRVSLNLQEADTMLRKVKDLQSRFAKLHSVRGHIELQNLSLTGAYDDPLEWTFAGTGTFNQVEIRHAEFPDRMTLSRGKFAAQQGRIIFSAAVMSDAALITGGTFEYKKKGPAQFEMNGTGTMGIQMTRWLSRYVELPEELSLRSPLIIVARRLAWREGGEISFRGQATVADGPVLSLDVVKKPQGLTLPQLNIDDDDRHARMSLQLAKDNLVLSFSGELTQETIDKVFVSAPMKGSSLRGDIQVTAALADPIRFSARGQIDGSNLLIPLGTEKALIEKISIAARGDRVLVRSADLRWGKSHFTVSGTTTAAKEALRVDLDVAGDQLDWQALQDLFGDEQQQQKRAGIISFPDVEGTIRLKADRFTFQRFDLSPLALTTAISPSGIRADIDHGIACGITVTGRVDIVDKEIGLDLQLAATDAQLEPTAVCLTNQQNDVKGIYSARARVAGRGERGRLLRSLKGNFEFSARDGEFIRSPGIDATFDYLNATGDFKLRFPDLDQETFPYRYVGIKGRIEGELILGDEVNVESLLINLSGQGKVDLERKQIDGKGLIAVLKPVDEVISRIPVISSLLGGSLVGIPVRVTGSLDRPDITYLSPADVGAELLNVPLRILGLPLGAIRLFTPGGDRNITK